MNELPTPAGLMTVTYGIDRKVKVSVFDEQQMKDYAAQAVAAEREACAALLEANAMACENPIYRSLLQANAAEIRCMGQDPMLFDDWPGGFK